MSEEKAKHKIDGYTAYRSASGISSSILADFAEAPDVALMEKEPKGYFEEGRAFERLIQDYVQGTRLFEERFFCTDCAGVMPNELITWIEEGHDLEQYYVYTKKGPLSETYKTRHAFLDACKKHPGRLPITAQQYHMLERMVNNLLDCRVSLFQNDPGLTMRELLIDAGFQVPIRWITPSGLEKKALLDVLATIEIDGATTYLAIDLKSSASLGKFRSMYYSRYWIQDCHYSEALSSLGAGAYPTMVFAVAAKDKPFLAQCFRAREDRFEENQERYAELCQRFAEWETEGRPGRGWKETAEL